MFKVFGMMYRNEPESAPVIELTDAQKRDQAEHEAALARLENIRKPELVSQPAADDLTEDEQFSQLFLKTWGTGWRQGYHSDPDEICECPFGDPEHRQYWEDGVACGFRARQQLEPQRKGSIKIEELAA